jgi:hypothetical protein
MYDRNEERIDQLISNPENFTLNAHKYCRK